MVCTVVTHRIRLTLACRSLVCIQNYAFHNVQRHVCAGTKLQGVDLCEFFEHLRPLELDPAPATTIDAIAAPHGVEEGIQRDAQEIKSTVARLRKTLDGLLVESLLKQFRGVATIG